MYGPTTSMLTPLSRGMSSLRMSVRYSVVYLSSSKKPMCFERMLPYTFYLILKVNLSDSVPNE